MRITISPYRRPSFPSSVALASVLAMMFALGAPPRADAGITDNVKYAKLANGLQVIVLENHKAPVATFNVFYHVGSRNERFGKTGISHLCDHLMFRGNKKLAPEEYTYILQVNG